MVLAGRPPRADLLNWRLEEADLSIAVDGGWESFRAGVGSKCLDWGWRLL